MTPAHPPLPTACSLPFHPTAGSHTSILISESADGRSVTVTRQNSGSFANACAAARDGEVPPGGMNAPAATIRAEVMLLAVSGREDSSAAWPSPPPRLRLH